VCRPERLLPPGRDVEDGSPYLATVVAVSASAPSRCVSRASRATRATNARRALAWLAGAAIAGGVALAGAGNADAQDTNSLQSIDPANGASLEESPDAIVLTFTQEVRSDDQIPLQLTCNSLPQAPGNPTFDDDGIVATWELAAPLPQGSCTIAWRLIDAEGSEVIPLQSSTFRVDSAPVTTAPAATTVPGGTTAPFTTVTVAPGGAAAATDSADAPNQGSSGGAQWLGRLLSTLAALALMGGLALIALGWPEGPEYVVTVRYLRAVWVVGLVGTVIYIVAFAARSGDLSFAAAMNPSAWLDLNDAGWPGRGALLRLVLIAGCGWVAMRPERIIDPTSAMWAWGLPGATLLAVALSRVEGPVAWLGVLIGFGHLLASAAWFGGVALVARVVLAGPGEEDLVHATRAFSRISTKAMLAVVLTGVAQMVRLVGNPFDSSHGRVLLLKVLAVAAMLFVAVAARQQVALRMDKAHEMTVPLADRFRRAFGAEAAIGVVVLAFSGWMLSLTPAKVDPLAGERYAEPIQFVDAATGIEARVFIGPSRVGRNGFRIEVEAPQEGINGLTLRFIPPAGSNANGFRQLIPLTTAGTAVLPTSEGLPFTAAGQWTLELIANTTTGSQPGAQLTFAVANADGTENTIPAANTTPAPAQAPTPGAVVTSVVDQQTSVAPFVTNPPIPTNPPTSPP
jgi:copper transport protein